MKRLLLFTLALFLTTSFFFQSSLALPNPPMADLVVTSFVVDPPQPRAHKDMITIRLTVKNNGNLTVPQVTSLAMGVWSVDYNGQRIPGDAIPNAIPWYTNNVPQLVPGGSIVISKTITLNHTGRHMISGVIITEGLQVGQENAANNSFKFYFLAASPPAPSDLVLDQVSRTAEGRIKLRMYNCGAAIPDIDREISYVKVTIDGTTSKTIFLRDMDPTKLLSIGEPAIMGSMSRIYLNYIWPATGAQGIQLQPGQSYSVKVVLDYNSRISDSNGSNNSKTVTL